MKMTEQRPQAPNNQDLTLEQRGYDMVVSYGRLPKVAGRVAMVSQTDVSQREFYVGAKILPNGTLDLRKAARWLGPATEVVPTIKNLHQQFDTAVEEIKRFPSPKAPLTHEAIDILKPYTHYTSPGNIFQILRFGIQSGNFKNRLSAMRTTDPSIDMFAEQMSGFRFKQGSSYQGKDSICLAMFSERSIGRANLQILIDPSIKVFGEMQEERTKTGYGHGIDPGEGAEGFEISNRIAYQTEVLAANIVPPSSIKGIVIHKNTHILYGLSDVTRNNVLAYNQAKRNDPGAAKEDLLANSRLIAALSNDANAEKDIDEFSNHIETMTHNELLASLNTLQKNLLKKFVGEEKAFNETAVREAIENKFGFKFVYAEDKQ